MKGRNLWSAWGGMVLIGLGAVILFAQLLRVNIWSFIWPFFILAVSAVFFIGMAAGGRSTGALAVPGSIIGTVGLILLVQNTFGIWGTWAYAWGLVISGAGIGLLIFGGWSRLPDLIQAGRVIIIIGLGLFLVFGIFFELGASLLGLRSPGGVFWPVLLILAGLSILVGRPLLRRAGSPGARDAAITSGSDISSSTTDEAVLVDLAGTGTVDGQLTGVRRVKFRAVGDLTIHQGEREGLDIEASQAMSERIRTEVRGATLEIRLDYAWWVWLDPGSWNMSPIRYHLYLHDLEALDISGLGNAVVPELSARHLELALNGAGNITIRQLNVTGLAVRLAGLGNIEVAGSTESQEVDLSGAGSYEAARLESKSARVCLHGLGNSALWVTEELDAELSGAGNIDYSGSPRVNQKISGLGNIRRVGGK
jgi:hypothetical protein